MAKLSTESVLLLIIIAAAAVIGVVLMKAGKNGAETREGSEKAPELAGIAAYINTNGENISISANRGKVVMVDFWTYSCINCIRTLPYLNEWYAKYKDQGFVIIGVHTPEFEFEKDANNVRKAVDKYGIRYPVALDNDYKTWRAYRNSYWPRKYLIDVDGYIRYDHIGEGGYEETERAIQNLLKERAERLKSRVSINETVSSPKGAMPVSFHQVRTPEIYFGYQFIRQPLGNMEGYAPENKINYSLPKELKDLEQNRAYLEGEWRSNSDNMELVSGEGKIALKYDARAVNIVAGSDKNATVEVLVDGKSPDSSNAGLDIKGTKADVNEFRMYNVVLGDYGKHELLLKIRGKGLRIYTFTFG